MALLLRPQRAGDGGAVGVDQSKVKDATHEAVSKLGRLLHARGGRHERLARRPSADTGPTISDGVSFVREAVGASVAGNVSVPCS